VAGDGTATVSFDLPGPGTVDLTGTGINPASVSSEPGPQSLPVTPDAASLASLAQTGKADVVLKLLFTPQFGGTPAELTQAVTLLKPLPPQPQPQTQQPRTCKRKRVLKRGKCVKKRKKHRKRKHRGRKR
jgi:hypothetical protein